MTRQGEGRQERGAVRENGMKSGKIYRGAVENSVENVDNQSAIIITNDIYVNRHLPAAEKHLDSLWQNV